MRLQFDLSTEKVEEIDALMNTTGIATRKLLVEYALANFKWSIAQASDGRAIVAYDAIDNSYRELVMPPFEVVNPNGRTGTGAVPPGSQQVTATLDTEFGESSPAKLTLTAREK